MIWIEMGLDCAGELMGKCTRRSTRPRCFSAIAELEFGLGVNVGMRDGARGKTGRPDCKSSKPPTRSWITDVRAD